MRGPSVPIRHVAIQQFSRWYRMLGHGSLIAFRASGDESRKR
jgi:hypothetical protein